MGTNALQKGSARYAGIGPARGGRRHDSNRLHAYDDFGNAPGACRAYTM